MMIYFIVFLTFALVILLMSVGVIFSGKCIKGSCGGINVQTGEKSKDGKCGLCGATFEEKLDRS